MQGKENLYNIGRAAKLAGLTAEALRHYDRIGLVSPARIDEWTGYRYYSDADIVRLQTVHALQQMDIPLKKIKDMLLLEDFGELVKQLDDAVAAADKKIAALEESRARIVRAKKFYAEKLKDGDRPQGIFVRGFKERVILPCDALKEPTCDNLHDYHRHFYAFCGDGFAFEDAAGIYCDGARRAMFAVCKKYSPRKDIIVLPAGRYICAYCTEKGRDGTAQKLLNEAKRRGLYAGGEPRFVLYMVELTGILTWDYCVQIPLGI